jgi:hypothetical protein
MINSDPNVAFAITMDITLLTREMKVKRAVA